MREAEVEGAAGAARGGVWVERVTAMAHVADVEASVAFYGLLGFVAESVMRDGQGRAFWASLVGAGGGGGDGARLMLTRASGAVNAAEQAVLFYMYSRDVAGLRGHLLAQGVHDGGRFVGAAGPNGGVRVVFEVARPYYMPGGELRVSDPDGYCILVGQLG